MHERLKAAQLAVLRGFWERRNHILADHFEIAWKDPPIRLEYKIRVARNMRILPSIAALTKLDPVAVQAKRIQGAGWLFLGSFSYIKDWVQLQGHMTSVDTEEIVVMKIVQVHGEDVETLTGGVRQLLEDMRVHFSV